MSDPNVNYFELLYDINKKEMFIDPKNKNIPKRLKSKAKQLFLQKFGNKMSKNDVDKFLRYQTVGKDADNYIYLTKSYQMDFDKNFAPVFTNAFPFDNDVKKEAFFIFAILNFIKNDPIIGKYYEYIIHNLQTKFALEFLPDAENQRYDLCFPDLNIVIEIDENHQIDDVSDDVKNKMMRLNGFYLMRLDFKKIHSGRIKTDINDKIYNNVYYGEFLKELKNRILIALLKNHSDVRQFYIIFLLNESLVKELKSITNTMNDNVILKDKLFKPVFDSKESYNTYKNIVLSINLNIELRKKIIDILSNINSSKDFINLFNLKDKCKNANYTNVITYTEMYSLLRISSKQITEFKILLCKVGIIPQLNSDNDTILATWKQLSYVIINQDINATLRDLLLAYYLEIEESYEKIITLLNIHIFGIQGTPDAFNTCMKYVEKKYKSIYVEKDTMYEKKYNDMIASKQRDEEFREYVRNLPDEIYDVEEIDDVKLLPFKAESYEEYLCSVTKEIDINTDTASEASELSDF